MHREDDRDHADDAPEHRFEEGSEAPPPGVRAMAFVRWMLLAMVALAAVFAVYSYARPLFGGDAKSAEKGAKYICPMHAQIISDRPGECPICHMDLVPAPQAGAPAPAPAPRATSTYTQGYVCPMDADVHSDTPGTCPKCKMDLEPVAGWTPPSASASGAPSASPASPAASANAAAARVYTCPMHADVRANAPGRCPFCGMDLEIVPDPKPPTAPPDTAPITLSLDRVQAIGVRTALVEEQRGEGGLRLTAAIEVPEQGRAEVHVRAAGYVEAIHVKDLGVKVKAGEPLVSVYSPEVLQAEQELIAMSAWPALDKRDPPTSAARKRLELLGVGKETIDRIIASGQPVRAMAVGSPISGYVTRKDVVLGSYAMPDKVLFEVADLKGVYLVASAYPHQLAVVRVGDEATFTTPSLPGHVFSTKVDLVYPSMDVATRTARVRFRVDNKDLNLRPGQFGIVQIAGKHVHARMIPMDAVIDTGRSIYVFVAKEGGRFEARNVELGEQIGSRFIVKSGLAEGERVVSGATFLIDAESRLQASLAASTVGKSP